MASKIGPVLSAVSCVFAVLAMPVASFAEPSVGVSVDWQALDALPPAPQTPPSNPLVLRPPPAKIAAAPAAERPAATAPAPAAPTRPQVVVTPPRAVQPPAPPPAAQPPAAATASLSAPPLAPGRIGMVPFAKGEVDVPPDQASFLNSVAQRLAGNAGARLQLIAYASGSADDALEARRISLARAVQMRTYLIEKGVPSVRMDVRALGDRDAGGGPPDRVDLVIVTR